MSTPWFRIQALLCASLALALLVVWGPAQGGVPTQLKPERVRGAELYEVNCWMCHGKKGLGDGPAAKELKSRTPAIAGRIDELGLDRAADLVMKGTGDMPGYTETLSRRDAIRVLKWLDGLDPSTGEDK